MLAMATIDTRDLQAPAPVEKTERMLRETAPGNPLQIVGNSATALSDIKALLTEKNIVFQEIPVGNDEWILSAICR